MMKRLGASGWKGWLVCALCAVLVAVAANLYILLAKPFGATQGIAIADTGPGGSVIATIVPYVWLVLFAFMGTTLWLIVRRTGRMGREGWLVAILILLCAGYPIYTGSLNLPWVALGANGLVIATAILAAYRIWPLIRAGALLLLPVALWVAVASLALLAFLTGTRF